MKNEDTQVRCVQLDALMPVIREQLAQGKSVHMFPQGISMLPMLRQGRDGVTLSPVPARLKKYDIPLYRRDNGHYVLHRVVRVGDTYTCMGDNQFVPEPGLRHDQMIAVVTQFDRDGKKYTVDDWTYRIYCRIWHYSRFGRRVWRWFCRRIRRLRRRQFPG